MWKRFLGLVFFIAFVCAARDASAQDAGDLARAAHLKTQGDDFVRDLRYREALTAYDTAYAINHDPAILYNRGRALDALGEEPQALDAFEEFEQVAPAELKARVPKLDELIATTRARVATIVVQSNVAGSTLFVRSHREGVTPITRPLRFTTGPALIEVQAAGHRSFGAELELTSGKPIVVNVVLVKDDVAPVAERPSQGSNAWKWAGISAGSIALTGVAMGAAFGVMAITRQTSADAACPGHVCDPAGSQLVSEARTFATLSTASFVVSGVALAAAILLFVWRPGSTKTEPQHARVTPLVGPTFAGLEGTF